MPATKLNLVIERGRTFEQVVRWESEPFLFAAIQSISNSAPALITTQAPHGIPDGWRVAVVGAKGLTLLNAMGNPPKLKDFHRVRVPSTSTVEINPISTALEPSYSGGGFLQFYTPVNLTDYSARMSIKDKIGGTVLMSFTILNERLVIDNTLKTIKIKITATDTTAITWVSGVYDLEMASPTGVVEAIVSGSVMVKGEVTT